jgi:3-methylfumaryl-CoA hydratase
VPLLHATFSYRLVAPTYGAQRITVTTQAGDGTRSARVRDGQGRTTATATLRPDESSPTDAG